MFGKKDGRYIRIYNAYMIRESIKEIDGRFYDPDERTWLVPDTPENIALLEFLGVQLDSSVKQKTEQQQSQDEKPIIPMPIKATPYQHQVRAFNFAIRMFGLEDSA